MPYIGKNPVGGGFHKLDNLTASATDTYALTLGSAAYYPESANQLLVSLNGVIQAPQDSFTVSGSDLVFDDPLTGSDSIDFVVALGDVLAVKTVTDGAITANKIGTDAVTTAKIQDGAVTAAKIDSLPTGSVLQVVNTKLTTSFDTQSTSFVDVTGLSATITPSSTSSKILVMFNGFLSNYGANNYTFLKILRGSTEIDRNSQIDYQNFSHSGRNVMNVIYDSPSTTSAVTYKIQIAAESASNTARIGGGAQAGTTTEVPDTNITLMEIAG
jgi:hypothetical protein